MSVNTSLPGSPVERALAHIWANCLGRARIGVDENFFALGGTDAIAAQIITDIEDVFQVHLTAVDLEHAPTIAALAAQIEKARAVHSPTKTPRAPGEPARLSFAQQRLWILDQLEPGSPVYNNAVLVHFTGTLNVQTLQATLGEIIRRHETLRTTFTMVDGEPRQCIAPATLFQLPVVERDPSSTDYKKIVMQMVRSEARRPFDLTQGPLVRAVLYRATADEHFLLIVLHHIISDGWSFGVLMRELNAIYTAFLAGQPSPLPALPMQYRDYARWQRDWMQGALLESQLAYWKQTLQDASQILALPTDRPRPPHESHAGKRFYFHLSAELTRQLKALSRQEGVTLFMTLLAGLQVLLHRYSGQADVCVGTPTANRNHPGIANLIGFFINPVVFRAHFTDDFSFRDFLHQVRQAALGAFQHQDVPFEMVVDALKPERGANYSPLFQVAFALQNMPLTPLDLPDVSTRWTRVDTDTAQFDLTIELMEQANGELAGEAEFATELFDEETIARMMRNWETLLVGIVTNPNSCLSELPLVSPEERQRLLVDWNATHSDLPDPVCVHELFQAQVDATPDAIALMFENHALTYRELNARANQLARYLVKRGVQPETIVAICVDRSIEMIVGVLGVLKAGGAYLPLDPNYPLERLAYMFADAQAQVLLGQAQLDGAASQLYAAARETIFLDQDWAAIAQENDANLECRATPDNLAYVIYTSGSTGKPKGTLLPHRGLFNLAVWQKHIFDIKPGKRILQFAPFSFDASVWEIFMALAHGGTLSLARQETLSAHFELVKLLRDHEITTVTLPPSMLAILPADNLPALETVIAAGEACSREIVLRWAPGRRFFNAYGPTETTVCASMAWCDANDSRPPTIGRPIANTQIYILDSHLQPVPIGVAGELCIGGIGLARGYLHRAELTAEKFVTVAWQDNVPVRLYRTGDWARLRADGAIEYLGRIDEQVKLHGFRIELREIVARLKQHPHVQEAIVLVRQDHPGDTRLVAYLTLDASGAVINPQWRDWLKQTLPEYMIPSAFVVMEAMPLTPNGKIDRRALPPPTASTAYRAEAFDAPRTPVEESIANIWMQVLQVKPIGIHANFFELGGHSLLATQIISRLRQVFQIELPVRALFEHSTIADLARQVEQALKAEPVQLPPLQPICRDHRVPLSYSQERMWFIHQLNPASTAYNMSYILRCIGELDESALQKAFAEIVRRHEILRTTFALVDGQPCQRISPPADFTIAWHDLRGVPDTQREAYALQTVREFIQRPFDLERGPLFQVAVYRLTDEHHWLVSHMHHIVSDAWSLAVMQQELQTLYSAFLVHQPAPLPALPVQYADFADWQRIHLDDNALAEQMTYWRQQLANLQPLELPIDRPRPATQTYRGNNLYIDLPAQLLDALERLSIQRGVTKFMTMLAAFQTLLYRYSGQTDIAVGVPIANRKSLAVEKLIGTFVNTLVIRTDLAGAPTFSELLERVRQVALDAFIHQDISFAKLVAALRPERDTSHAPFFQVLFNVINVPMPALHLPNLTLSPVYIDAQGAQFDLTVTLVDLPNLRQLVVNYNTDLFDQDTIVRLAGHFETLLTSIVADPAQRISELPLLTAAERRQLLVDWNNTARDYPRDQGVHQLFQAQAARTPDALAAVGESLEAGREVQWTYRELNERANRLAHYLQTLGIRAGARVGIALHRTVDMLASVLAVLKAGGAYLPLDPAFPSDRLAFMIDDAEITLLLTQTSLHALLPDHCAHVLYLDKVADELRQHCPDNLATVTTPDDLAYILYTSGSTGKPKGVQVLHRGLTNFLVAMQNEPGIRADDVLLSVTTLSFDIAGLELYLPLIAGAQVVIVPREIAADGARLSEKMASTGATLMQATPATWRMLLTAGWQGNPKLKILCGGEALPRELADALLARCGELWNMYGPTETTIWSTLQRVERDQPLTIGRPIANTQIYILDEHLQPVPIGVPGNLYIGGDGLARGYLNRPELNAERFIRNPFVADPAACMYHTGDVARYLPNGQIDYLGRSDNQVKVRGFRIELGEIETVLSRHPAVQQAIVIAHEFQPGDKRLVAYVQAKADSAPMVDELRAHLHEALPEYMLPAVFMMVHAFPLTPNGKIDRRALPRPALGQIAKRAFVPPRTEVEKQLVPIWERVLNTFPVGIHDDFFELGGHSLLGVQLFAQIEKAFGTRLPLGTLFQAPTIEQLAKRLKQKEHPPLESLVPIQPNGARPPFFCIHEYDGNVVYYRELSQRLGDDQPFYGLQARGLDGKQPPLESFEEIAAHYIREMQTVQPQGPYCLGGSSLGGMIAFEMAHQLRAQGEQVALVALFDTWSPGYLKLLQLPLRHVVARHTEALTRLSLKGQVGYLARRVLARLTPRQWLAAQRERMKWDAQYIACQIYLRLKRPLPPALLDFYVRLTMIRAHDKYVVKPYPGRITYFLAGDHAEQYYNDPRLEKEALIAAGFCSRQDADAIWNQVYPLGWGALAQGGLEIIAVPGTHAYLVREPHVKHLAEKLRACIDRAWQDAPSP